jgi:hypothetical protein
MADSQTTQPRPVAAACAYSAPRESAVPETTQADRDGTQTTKFCPVCHRPSFACKGDQLCGARYQRTEWSLVVMFFVAHAPLVFIALLILGAVTHG